MYIRTHKITSLLLITVFLFSGCGGGTNIKEHTLSQSETNNICTQGTAMQKGHITDISTHDPIANVKVTLNGCTTTTDANGLYIFDNISKSNNSFITFEKSGYILGSTEIKIKAQQDDGSKSTNFLEYSLLKHKETYKYAMNKKISTSYVNINPSLTFSNQDNLPNSGEVSVLSTMLDMQNDDLIDIFPGTFSGITMNADTVAFTTYGLISIAIEDNQGDTLELENGEYITLTFNGNPSEENPSEVLPLWYYDKTKGKWQEDGYAQLQDDGSYKGQVTHLGIWSLNKIIEEDSGIYRGRILYPDGTTVKNARVTAKGKNWKVTNLSTDDNGLFELRVIPNSSFHISAYNYKLKYNAKYDAIIPAILPNETIEN